MEQMTVTANPDIGLQQTAEGYWMKLWLLILMPATMCPAYVFPYT